MTTNEREKLRCAVEKIPCALTVATDQGKGAAWLGCRECARCLLVQALGYEDPFGFIDEHLMTLPDHGGHELREDLKKLAHGSAKR